MGKERLRADETDSSDDCMNQYQCEDLTRKDNCFAKSVQHNNLVTGAELWAG